MSSQKKSKVSKISIIATVRNERDTIEAFVDSLFNQSISPDEIIIVDGESNDGTREILEQYEKDGKIRLISQACNIAQGRNLGVAAAQSELIAVTDAGCEVENEWLEQILLGFAEPENPDVVAGNFTFRCLSPFETAVSLATFSPKREESEHAKFYPSSRSLGFRKDAWERAGGYPEWLYAAEDTLFNIRLRQIGCNFTFGKNARVSWRPRENWRSLGKQRFNFARGNARIDLGTQGYLINLQYHLMTLAPLLLIPINPWIGLLSIPIFARHVQKNLWSQAKQAEQISGDRATLWRVLAVMEFTRLVGMVGFLAGRWDRLTDSSFIRNQIEWMGVDSVDKVPTRGK